MQVRDNSADNLDHIMVWVASTTCFFGFMRVGQDTYNSTAHLSFKDIVVASSYPQGNGSLHQGIRMDPFRKGINLFIGHTNNDLCPIAAMIAYLAIWGSSKGPLFHFRSSQPLTCKRFVAEVRDVLSPPSFRISAATTAAQCGIANSTIQLLGI